MPISYDRGSDNGLVKCTAPYMHGVLYCLNIASQAIAPREKAVYALGVKHPTSTAPMICRGKLRSSYSISIHESAFC